MGESKSAELSWQILRYARFLANEDDSKLKLTSTQRNEQKWKHVSPIGKEGFKLAISSGHLLLTNGDLLLENYFLPDMRSTMRGFIRGDSLLFVIKIKNEARKFRVRFAKGPHPKAEQTCEECGSKLSFFFPVKPFEAPECYKSFTKPKDTNPDQRRIEGQVPITEVAEVLRTKDDTTLPISYSNSGEISMDAEDLNTIMRAILSEASFPSFVEAVGKELDTIVNSKGEE